jgi:hypothetical protein
MREEKKHKYELEEMKIHVLILVGEIPKFENCFLEDGNVCLGKRMS